MTASQIAIRPLTRDMIPRVGKLFERVFQQPFQADFYEWRFFTNPFGPPMVLIAEDGDRVVSHYALCPSRTHRPSGRQIRSAQSMTTMTDPEYGGRGLFARLGKQIYQTCAEQHGLALVFGFPNANIHDARNRKLSWIDIHPMFFMAKDVAAEKDVGFRQLDWPELTEILDRHHDVEGYQPYERTAEFIEWRYRDIPGTHYQILAASEDETVATVVKAFKNDTGKSSLDIIDFVGSHRRVSLEAVIRATTSYAKTHGLTAVQSRIDLFHPAFGALERLRFRPRSPIGYFGLCLVHPNKSIDLNPRKWRVTMGDSDVY